MRELPAKPNFRITSPNKAPIAEQIEKVQRILVPPKTGHAEIHCSLSNSTPVDPRLHWAMTALAPNTWVSTQETSPTPTIAYGSNGEAKPMPTYRQSTIAPKHPTPNPSQYQANIAPHQNYHTPRVTTPDLNLVFST